MREQPEIPLGDVENMHVDRNDRVPIKGEEGNTFILEGGRKVGERVSRVFGVLIWFGGSEWGWGLLTVRYLPSNSSELHQPLLYVEVSVGLAPKSFQVVRSLPLKLSEQSARFHNERRPVSQPQPPQLLVRRLGKLRESGESVKVNETALQVQGGSVPG